jgi:cytochrome c peroxidase
MHETRTRVLLCAGAGVMFACGMTPDLDEPPEISPEARAALEGLSPAFPPEPPPDASNAYADDDRAAALGQQVFFDRGFSGALLDSDNTGGVGTLGRVGEHGKVACSDCHDGSAGFSDRRSARGQVSLGAGWGTRRAPSLLDVGHARLLMWDGRRDAGYNQPIAAIESGVEMNGSRLHAAQRIHAVYRERYEEIFGAIEAPLDDPARFPQLDGASTGCRTLARDRDGVASTEDCHGMPGDGAEFDALSTDDQIVVTQIAVNLGKAIAAYLRRLSCGPSRFDAWMHGDLGALTPSEQRGAQLFVGERSDGTVTTGCAGCHSGPLMSDQRFHNVGLMPVGVGIAGSFYDRDDHGARDGLSAALEDPLNVRGMFSDGDDGRLPSGVGADMDGAFRTPTLRCVAMRPSFMHTGQLSSLEDVVSFFDRGGDESGYHGTSEIAPLGLTRQERADLVAFLRALDGPGPDDSLRGPP